MPLKKQNTFVCAGSVLSTVHALRVMSEPHLARTPGSWRGKGVSCGWGGQAPANPHARQAATRGGRGRKKVFPSITIIDVIATRDVASDVEPRQADCLEAQLQIVSAIAAAAADATVDTTDAAACLLYTSDAADE